MNGRLYDPYLQRFLSPDPFVQAPGNAQNFNRYSYCLNNPLMYTDPSGYKYEGKTFLELLGSILGNINRHKGDTYYLSNGVVNSSSDGNTSGEAFDNGTMNVRYFGLTRTINGILRWTWNTSERKKGQFLIRYSWSGGPPGPNPLAALMDSWLQGPRSGEMPGVDYADRGDQGGGGFGSQIAWGLFKTNPNWGFAGRAWQITSRFTWELPQTLLGLGFAGAYGMFGGFSSANYHKGIGFYESSRFPDGNGISLGNTIIFGNSSPLSLLKHEFGHTVQSRIFGPLYLPFIALPSLIWRGLYLTIPYFYGNYSYDDFFIERNATNLGNRYY